MASASSSNPDRRAVLPLQELLVLLRWRGLAIGPVECADIRLLLSMQHAWRATQLQTALRSIVARDANQRVVFDLCFRDLFASWLDAERTEGGQLDSLDLAAALADFARLPEPEQQTETRESGSTPPPVAVPESETAPESDSDSDAEDVTIAAGRGRSSRKSFAASVIVTSLLIGLFTWQPWEPSDVPLPPGTELSLDRTIISFGSLTENEIRIEDVRITNNDSVPAVVTRISFRGDNAGDFALHSLADTQEFTIASGATRAMPVHFTRVSPGESQAQLVIEVTGRSDLVAILLASRAAPAPSEFVRPNRFEDPVVGERVEITETEWLNRPAPVDDRGLYLVLCTAGFGAAIWLCWWIIDVRYRAPKDEPPEWRVNAEGETFSFRDIGGAPEPLIPLRAANRMGDLLGFFQTEESSAWLDLDQSIDASVKAGYPSLRFEPVSQTREVVILEDANVHPDFQSTLVDDLCHGLERTGVTLRRLRFDRRVDEVTNMNGGCLRLKELPHAPDAYAFLLVTDGRAMGTRKAASSLVALTEFPRVAWIDLREPRFRGDQNRLARQNDIPVFSATTDGLKSALRAFQVSGRQLAGDESHLESALLPGLATQEMSIEDQLGDAILWAADCAQLQPCSVALAQRLRQEFHPALPSTRIQRLFRLKDTVHDSAGFEFSTGARAILQEIWLARRPEVNENPYSLSLHPQPWNASSPKPASQDEVLQFILAQVEAAEPENDDADETGKVSLARLTWESAREWVRFSLEPENSLERLSQVQQTPSGGWLSQKFEHAGTGDGKVRMRTKPSSREAEHRLARVAPGAGVESPLVVGKRKQRTYGIALALLCLVTLIPIFILAAPPEPEVWAVEGPGSEYLVLLGRPDGEDDFRKLGTWNSDWTSSNPRLRSGWDYAVMQSSASQGSDRVHELPARSSDVGLAGKITLDAMGDATYPLVAIQPGTFLMGSPESEEGRRDNETLHEVTLSAGFLMGQTEVTNRLYREVMGLNAEGSAGGLPDHPVVKVTWDAAVRFCEQLTLREQQAGRMPAKWKYVLPTEAQWEYACRAGSETETPWSFGDDAGRLGDYAWFADNSGDATHSVGQKKPNKWTLYDMHGSVWEWCRDTCDLDDSLAEGDSFLSVDLGSKAVTDPVGSDGASRIFRGGGWINSALGCRLRYTLAGRAAFSEVRTYHELYLDGNGELPNYFAIHPSEDGKVHAGYNAKFAQQHVNAAFIALITADEKLAREVIDAAMEMAVPQMARIYYKRNPYGYDEPLDFAVYQNPIGRNALANVYDYLYSWMTESEQKQLRGILVRSTQNTYSHGMWTVPSANSYTNFLPWWTGNLLTNICAIEGENGYDPVVFEEAKNAFHKFYTYGIQPDGSPWDRSL